MRTVPLNDAMHVQVDEPCKMPDPHLLLCEVAERLQELDDIAPGDENSPPVGVATIHRLAAIDRKTRRGYRLILDVLSQQRSLSCSLDELAAKHYNAQGYQQTRQAWLQHMQADVMAIEAIWPEVGNCLRSLMKRRQQVDNESQ